MLYHAQASHCFVRFGLFNLQSFHQPAVLLRRQHLRLNFGSRPLVRSLLQPLVEENEAIPFPVQPLDPVPPSAAEREQRVGKWVKFKLLLDDACQAVYATAKIRIPAGNVDFVGSAEVVQHVLNAWQIAFTVSAFAPAYRSTAASPICTWAMRSADGCQILS